MAPPLASPMLLVDGYNVVGAWPELRRARDRHNLDAARQQLIEVLINYSAFEGLDTRVVFDAQYQAAADSCEVITGNLAVCYTSFGQTADTYIEKICADFATQYRSRKQRLIVATSDRAHWLMVVGYGAEWMPTQRLAEVVDATTRQVRHKQQPRRQPSRQLLGERLKPIARKHLEQLLTGLP